MSYAPTILQSLFGLATGPDSEQWYVGLWTGPDPLGDLASAEIPGTRLLLSGNLTVVTDYVLGNVTTVVFSGVPGGNISGWFVVNGLEGTQAAWKGSLATIFTAADGDAITFTPGTILLAINDGNAVFTDPGGGGGGGPG